MLGPLMFLILINDVCIVDANNRIDIELFIGDIILYSSVDVDDGGALNLQEVLNPLDALCLTSVEQRIR